ncbi:MAG: two pore domain potassium channel family protein [Acidimicrobiales bacterium]|nr:two pore domain potassium channel family protein [Acidimicrobiales bacterium]
MDAILDAVDVAAVSAGLVLAGGVGLSAVRTVVLPRGGMTRINRVVSFGGYRAFRAVARRRRTWAGEDRVMALYAPLTMVLLPVVWLALVLIGFTLVFWGLDQGSPSGAFLVSGSTLFTLGYAPPRGDGASAVGYIEAFLGLGLVALLITYLPTLYNAFSRREVVVMLAAPLFGTPPSGETALLRLREADGIDQLEGWAVAARQWFAEIQESHSSFAALCFFRSHQHDHSWVTAAGATLDMTALVVGCLDVTPRTETVLLLNGGAECLTRLCRIVELAAATPPGDAPLWVSRAELDEVLDRLQAAGVPVRTDRDACWDGFVAARGSYDGALVALAAAVIAPPAPWSADRDAPPFRPRLMRRPPRAGDDLT